MARKQLPYLIAGAYTFTLVTSSLLSLRSIPMDRIALGDKMLHFLAYFFLVLVWAWAAGSMRKVGFNAKKLWIIAFSSFIFGIVIELLQVALTSYRQADVYDAVANASGVILAVVLILGWNKMKS